MAENVIFEENVNKVSLETLAGALAYSMGVEPPMHAAPANEDITAYVDKVFDGKKADRLFIYDGDAIAQWIYEKYPYWSKEARERIDLEVPFRTAYPSLTPICFGTMYTGAAPQVHGIVKYEKKLITIDTLFDAMVRAGKKVALLTRPHYSVAEIFKERPIDYFYYPTYAEVNAKAAELIMQDEYDFIFCYNGNYDDQLHKTGPESPETLSELRYNFQNFCMFDALIQRYWKKHNTLVTFGMDHGCHSVPERPEKPGNHGSADAQDMNIVHLFKGHPATE